MRGGGLNRFIGCQPTDPRLSDDDGSRPQLQIARPRNGFTHTRGTSRSFHATDTHRQSSAATMSRDVKDWGDYEDDEELPQPVEVRGTEGTGRMMGAAPATSKTMPSQEPAIFLLPLSQARGPMCCCC